eukprot:2036707-Rhodomonas_salina.1
MQRSMRLCMLEAARSSVSMSPTSRTCPPCQRRRQRQCQRQYPRQQSPVCGYQSPVCGYPSWQSPVYRDQSP